MNAPDQNPIEDKLHNLLSFRITENEFKTREKRYEFNWLFSLINY